MIILSSELEEPLVFGCGQVSTCGYRLCQLLVIACMSCPSLPGGEHPMDKGDTWHRIDKRDRLYS